MIARLGVWQLEGAKTYEKLLRFAVDAQNFEKSHVVIALDLSKPWDLVQSLELWLNVIKESIEGMNLPRATLIEGQNRGSFVQTLWKPITDFFVCSTYSACEPHQ